MERIDFKAVKERVTMPQVLARYGLSMKQSNPHQLRGDCPLPAHPKDSKGTFSVSVDKNVWTCFHPACKASGNVLDFVMALDGVTVREAATKLASAPVQAVELSKPVSSIKATELNCGDNPPLKFTLQGVDPTHPYVVSRISEETARRFGVGFYRSKQGTASMDGRVVIPIHNERGHLVAYVGRAIDSSEPRYKMPVGFMKSLVLFNRCAIQGDHAVVTEGFFDCLKVEEAGFPCVALMGSSLSEAQERLLPPRVTLFLDGDKAGMDAAEAMLPRIARTRFVRRVVVEGRQPDQMKREELQALLS